MIGASTPPVNRRVRIVPAQDWRQAGGSSRNLLAMTKHNTYFDGKVQSLGFERNGRRATAAWCNQVISTSTLAAPNG